jgi:hypothetical protein
MSLTPWVTALCLSHPTGPLLAAPTVVGRGVMSLTSWATAADVQFYKISGGPYIVQNRDRKNIKKFKREVRRAQSWAATGGAGASPLLPPWPTALGHNAVAHGAMSLTPWVTALCLSHPTGPLLAAPTAVGSGGMSLTPWTTAADV